MFPSPFLPCEKGEGEGGGSLKPDDVQRARKFRKNMSELEHKLWQLLRHKGLELKFSRQYPGAPYVLDFYCPQTKLCVELDGDLRGLQLERDARRDAWLAAHGIQTLWITTAQLYENPEVVVEFIRLTCTQRRAKKK